MGGGRIDRRVSIFEIEFPVKIELFILSRYDALDQKVILL